MRILSVYERYFARLIYGVFAFILFAVLALFVFFDMLSELESVQGNYTSLVAFFHVMLQAPTRIYEVLPIAVLISAIYVFSQLASQSEYTIFRVAGLNTRQALFSLFKLAVPLALTTFIFGEFIGPAAEQYAQKIKLEAVGATVSAGFRSGVWVKDRDRDNSGEITRFVNVQGLKADQSIQGITIYEFDKDYRLRVIRVAKEGRYQGAQQWQLNDVNETRFIELREAAGTTAQVAAARDALAPDFRAEQVLFPNMVMHSELTPQILSVLLVTPERMSTLDLFRYIRHLRDNKQDTQRYEIAFWKKVVYPLTLFVMVALALPFAYLHARAGAVGVKVFGGIMLGLSFHLSNTLFSHVGLLHTWPPIVSALVPGTLYLMVALSALRWVDRH
ncbi:MAG: LPS export ABC transporter permease LptG [Cupriavidus sp.]|jgi:lipopolysaccharide export system permease protein|uniref:LPS export ABC transporter permease LptG n=1 Tax=Cupriavidus pauculus TaxID=82633 RepID=UPI00078438A4|nr:LPS export ABC transporter permease LptG [Cupriavidus pauculus]MBU68902.1 LPS export ABC transporter permease LptG [Cupriavidus sp.]KAB0604333.1 LPS export ABC transporter permease LptG [Cupriavidus pauculus]MBY4733875.1 LPS export ABC transporter permease LptG [Cupriavidus pauculus]MCM3606538.1 LPS export ABC transporter permease LptG [Cupriavidus pauculus]UAL00624.1 LPS export ABC transporter permease LptG [Cupriavidus pauculus]